MAEQSSAARSNRRDQRVPARRTPEGRSDTGEEIVRVATRLFREQGYNGTSMTDVAGAIGVTAASLYYHFENKQSLLLSVLRAGMDRFLPSLEAIAAAADPPERKLDRAIANHLAFVLQRSDAVSVFIRERRFLESPYAEEHQVDVDRYDELFTSIVAEAAQSGRLPQIEPKVLSMLVLGSINSIVEWYRPDGGYNEETLARMLGELIDRMLIRSG
jgi:TetR/AcrR family transcriptional regulator, cholesterol catabolism regulator